MTSFDEMLDRYGLAHDLFGVSSATPPVAQDKTAVQGAHWIPAAQNVTTVPDAPGTEPAALDNHAAVVPKPEALDPSSPPWGYEEDDDLLACAPDLNDDETEYLF